MCTGPKIFLALAFIASLASSNASALPLTYRFNGAVTSVDPGLSSLAAVGDTVQYSLTADGDTPLGGTPDFLVYSVLDTRARFGTHAFAQTPTSNGRVNIIDSSPAFSFRDLLVSLTIAVSGPTVAGLELGWLDVELSDASGTVFSSADLPTSLNLAAFDRAQVSVNYCTDVVFFGSVAICDGLQAVRADIRSVEVIAAPEPASLGLVGLGLLGGLWRRGMGRA